MPVTTTNTNFTIGDIMYKERGMTGVVNQITTILKIKKAGQRLLPTVKQMVDFGVPVEIERKMFFPIKDYPEEEGGLVLAHKRLTKKGDKVIIVGGGYGITTVVASRVVGMNGLVRVYEAGDKSIKQIMSTIELNKAYENIILDRKIVGHIIDSRGDYSDLETLSPSELPECDVLELDCEGAETVILEGLKTKPRVIVVEIHPWLSGKPMFYVIRKLEDKGYNIVLKCGHNGKEINNSELLELLALSKLHSKRKYVNGAKYPVIVAGEL